MKQCDSCGRKLSMAQSVITVEKAHYCSDICRQRHRGKTREERRIKKQQNKRSALRKGLPRILLGCFLLLVPLVLLSAGHLRSLELFNVFYFIPGGAICAAGIYHYKVNAPRRITSRRD